MTDEPRLTCSELKARLKPTPYALLKPIVENSFDPHRQIAEHDALRDFQIEIAFTGACPHPEKYVAQVKASGDFSWGLTGGHCRACGQKVKPKIVNIVWETDVELPSPPSAA